MRPHQKGEATGDTYAAEILALKLEKMDDQEKLRYLVKSVEFYCTAESDEIRNYRSDSLEVHPSPRLRVAGIIGANLSIRKALGCKKENSKDSKTCGLKSKLEKVPAIDWLNDDNTGVGTRPPNKQSAPAKQ